MFTWAVSTLSGALTQLRVAPPTDELPALSNRHRRKAAVSVSPLKRTSMREEVRDWGGHWRADFVLRSLSHMLA
jgi:hypothetical protein